MKKTLLVLLAAVLMVGQVACSSTTADTTATTTAEATTAATAATTAPAETTTSIEAKKIVIGYSCNNFNDTGQVYVKDGAKAKAEELGMEFLEADAQEDVLKQQDQVQAFITEKVDVLIVVAVSTDAMDPIIQAAKDAGIPLVFVNRNPFGENKPAEGCYFVGSEEVVAGQQQAEYLGELLGDEGGNVFILQGKLDNEAAIKRTSGFVDAANANFPNIKVMATEVGNWQRDQGVTITENWLTAYGDEIDAIVANNDEMALGAVEALQKVGRTDVIVLGVDFTPDAKAAILDGTLKGSVRQDLAGQGAGGVQVAFDVFNGGVKENPVWIPFMLVTDKDVGNY